MSQRHPKNILVLRYRFVGDTILTVPFLRNLRKAEPDAHIAWVVAPGSAEVIKGIPYVDELVVWDPVTIHADSRGSHGTLSSKLSFIRELRRRRFDKVYVLKRSLSSAIMAWLTGAPERVGFDTEGRGLLLTKRVPYKHDRHEVQNFLDVLRADGVPVHDDYLEAWVTEEERTFARDFLEKHGVGETDTVIGMHCFAANRLRAWHEENFAAVANHLQERYRVRVMIFGGPSDAPHAEYFRQHISPQPVIAIGASTLRQSMALVERCALMICNDSGIMHLAAALNIPLVAIFGPQSPVKFGPWGKNCRVMYRQFPCSPCRQKFFTECEASLRGRPQCVEALSPDDVITEAAAFLESM